MSIKCLIIDDEPLAINVIENYLDKIDKIDIVKTFNNAINALNFLKENKEIDLIFLDVNMPLLDGINFVKSLQIKPLIIVTTAYEKFAVQTYELNVLDYLVKPIPFTRFLLAINRVYENHSNKISHQINNRPYIFIKVDKKKNTKIYLDEIVVIESLKDYLKITTTTNRYIIHQTLSSFTESLPSKNFIRIHRSYTIAINKIDSIQGNSIEIDGLRYRIGRTYIEHVKEQILNS